jgi:autotransporter family porin
MRILTGALILVAVGCTAERPVGHFVDAGAEAGTIDGQTPESAPTVDAARFTTIDPGLALPSDEECQARIRASGWEPRPSNNEYNQRRPTAAQLAQLVPWDSNLGFDARAVALGRRVSGQASGSTDDILRWAACKWGFDEDWVRAEVTRISDWRQDTVGDWTSTATDCPPEAPTRTGRSTTECPESYGLYQLMWHYYRDSWPMLRDDTAFHVDFALGLRRVCFEGWASYLAEHAPADKPYVSGDALGCGGADFSGTWYDTDARDYVSDIKQLMSDRPWSLPGF